MENLSSKRRSSVNSCQLDREASASDRAAEMTVLAHLHLYKNAGTTVDWILKRNFGTAFATIHGPNPDSVLSNAAFWKFLADRPEIRAVSSHHIRLPLGSGCGRPVVPVVMLRDPIDRIASMFEQERRQRQGQAFRTLFSSTIREWVKTTLANAPHMICDAQTMFIAEGGTYYAAPTRVEAREAERVLADLPFCGVVDCFEQSMVVLEAMVREWMPGFDCAHFPQNVSSGRTSSRPVRLQILRDELGPAIFDQLLAENRYDLELLEKARQLLAEKLHRIPNWQAKLRDLRLRMDRLYESITKIA